MKGRLCIITGANTGIGYHTAKQLAQKGATVVLVCRDQEKAETAQKEIKQATGSHSVYRMHCDLNNMHSIDSFTNEFQSRFTCLHVLINNAGAIHNTRQETTEGYEKTISTNYLAPFKLTQNLLPLLKEKPPSRIINHGSGLHRNGELNFEDLMMKKGYKGTQAYANSKLMLTTYTYALAERIQGTGVTANIVQPRSSATQLGRNKQGILNRLGYLLARPAQVTPKRGAETTVWAATEPRLANITGRAFHRKKEVETAPETYDKELQDKLWDKTVEILGISTI